MWRTFLEYKSRNWWSQNFNMLNHCSFILTTQSHNDDIQSNDLSKEHQPFAPKYFQIILLNFFLHFYHHFMNISLSLFPILGYGMTELVWVFWCLFWVARFLNLCSMVICFEKSFLIFTFSLLIPGPCIRSSKVSSRLNYQNVNFVGNLTQKPATTIL